MTENDKNYGIDKVDESRRKSLKEILDQDDSEYIPEEIDWGEPVGREKIFNCKKDYFHKVKIVFLLVITVIGMT